MSIDVENFKPWNSTFFKFSLITGGATEKVSQFILPQKPMERYQP